jgi:predicted PurR-regulated permease PerM
MKTIFLIFVAAVFLITMIFGVLIWRQTIVFEKKALAAKQKKEAYLQQLQLENEEKLRKQEERLDNRDNEEVKDDTGITEEIKE